MLSLVDEVAVLFQHRTRKLRDLLGVDMYAGDAVIHTKADKSLRDALQHYQSTAFENYQALPKLSPLTRLVVLLYYAVLLLEPLMLSYFIYLAVSGVSAQLLTTVIMAAIAVFAMVIWGDEHTPVFSKLRLTLSVPLFCILLYALSIVRAILIIMFVLKSATLRIADSKP
jgi:hypothetical protein